MNTTMIRTQTALDTNSFASIRVGAVFVWSALCNAYLSHEVDAEGYDFTLVELVTAEVEGRNERTDIEGGDPMGEIEIDGHVNTVEAMKVLIDIARNVVREDVRVYRANSLGQVA